MEGISGNKVKLIAIFGRPSSIAVYKSTWEKWVSWCCWQQIHPACAPLSEILDYLSTQFEKYLQHWTITSDRSTISACHDYVDGKPAEKYSRVSALMTGFFN